MPLSKFLSRIGQKYPTNKELEAQGVKSEKLQRRGIPDAPVPERSYGEDSNDYDDNFRREAQIPAYPQVVYQKQSTEEIQKILEKILEEKFQSITKEIESLKKISADVNKLAVQLDDKFEKIGAHLEAVKAEFEEKLSAHDSSMSGLSVEFRALRKVFDNVMPVMTDNVKELRDLVERMKK